jgi:hypothetical protein
MQSFIVCPLESDEQINIDLQNLIAQDQARALKIIEDIPEFVRLTTQGTVAQAQAQGLQSYVVNALMMRLQRCDSTEQPGQYDNIAHVWCDHRRPDTQCFMGAARDVFDFCEQAGYEPYVERALYMPVGLTQPGAADNANFKEISGDFRGYYFYIGIRWTVNLSE